MAEDVRSQMKELKLLDLKKVSTVSELVYAMSFCSFGARMLGEVADTLTRWVTEGRQPVIIYEGKQCGLLYDLLVQLCSRQWFHGLMRVDEYVNDLRIKPGGNVLVVGQYPERHEDELYRKAGELVFINQFGQAKPGQVRDGYFPNVVFADHRLILPILDACLLERLSSQGIKVADFLPRLERYGGVAGQVAHGAETLRLMVNDPDCTVFLTLSGAMTIAKMGLLVCDMIDDEMVDYVASTGALMAHGLVEGVGRCHYKYDPKHTDTVLAEQKLNRVTDTLEPEENFDSIEEVVTAVLEKFDGLQPISPSQFHREIGRYLTKHFPNERGILKSAYLHGVPVCTPAFVDSEVGNDVHVENLRRQLDGRRELVMDLELDTKVLLHLATGAKRTGIFSIGGGVPRNNTQNVAPLIEIINGRTNMGLKPSPFFYGCRIDPAPMWYGNLSGCTYSEGESWRKFSADSHRCEVLTDATIAWPFILKYVMDR